MIVISRVGGEEIQLSFSVDPNSLKTGAPSGGKAGLWQETDPVQRPTAGDGVSARYIELVLTLESFPRVSFLGNMLCGRV